MSHKDAHIILIEDDPIVQKATAQVLELEGFTVNAFNSAESALPYIHEHMSGIVISDIRLPGLSGFELSEKLQAIDPELPVVLITGHGDVALAVSAIRNGVFDFLTKPLSSDLLIAATERAMAQRALVIENRTLRATEMGQTQMPSLVGQSSSMQAIRTAIREYAPLPVDILLHGETGSGKEVLAQLIHILSGCTGPFVAINCGGMPESVFESEMFGYESGAFTGANKKRIGKIEYANDGTLFLDEIESMPLALQVKLLRVLQDRRVEKLGSNIQTPVNFRVISTTKSNLLKLSEQGKFRSDLYYRLGVVQIDIPNIAQRTDDIPLLISHFAKRAAVRYQRPVPKWTADEMQSWQQQHWPGNVRELKNFAERLVLNLNASNKVDEVLFLGMTTGPLASQLAAYEKEIISRAMNQSDEDMDTIAEQLGISVRSLYEKVKSYNIPTAKKRRSGKTNSQPD